MREKIVAGAMGVPIADEKIRLERTEKLYHVAATILNKKDMVDTSLRCLKEAREEVKGESSLKEMHLQLNQFNQLTDAELIRKKKDLESKIVELSRKDGIYEESSIEK